MKNPEKFSTPILIIGFNRPDLFAQVVDQVRLVCPQLIYVAIDGPRNQKDQDKIEDIKKQVAKMEKWCKVKTKFQDKNLGCKLGPVTAMNWFFEKEEMGIIMEDDVLADGSFFYFAQELLTKYKDDKRVGSLSGNNFQFGKLYGDASYYFSRYSHSCGWATWRRAWKLYDVTMSDYGNRKTELLNKVFDRWPDRFYWKLIFEGIVSGRLDTAWDYQWNWMMWKNSMLGIIPNNNLVKNIGFGRADATHTKYRSKFEDMKISQIVFPLLHPNIVERCAEADSFTQSQNYILWKEILMYLWRRLDLVHN
jgi:hypothetical protein